MIFDGEKLISVLPANKVGDMIYSHQGLTYGGLLIQNDIKFQFDWKKGNSNNIFEFPFLLDHLLPVKYKKY